MAERTPKAESASGTSRERLHRLVDELTDEEAAELELRLQARHDGKDPVLRAHLEAPEDDEPLTDEEQAAIQEGLNSLARGERRPLDEIARELGL